MKTIDYYNENAGAFVNDTVDVGFSEVQDRFLELLPAEAHILDFGCGSGRDAKYFIKKGYSVDAIDGSAEMCKIASENAGINVRHMMFSDLDEVELYDGIWACASVLHISKDELKNVLAKMITAVKYGGYIYVSFKYGTHEGYRGNRYYTDFTETTFRNYIGQIKEITITDEWISTDVRPGRSEEKWLNIILQKLNTV